MKKTLSIGLLGLATLLLGTAASAKAQIITGPNSTNTYSSNFSMTTPFHVNSLFGVNRTFGMHPFVNYNYGYNQSLNYRMLNRYMTLRVTPDFVNTNFLARNVVLVNRDFPSSVVVLRNQLTGPFSVNSMYVTVSDDLFNRIFTDINTTQNVDISVDTGNNTVSFNTLVGNVSSGDVSISVR